MRRPPSSSSSPMIIVVLILVSYGWNLGSAFVLWSPSTSHPRISSSSSFFVRNNVQQRPPRRQQQQHSAAGTTTTTSLAAAQARGTAIVAGATGYIGKSVVRECVRQGYTTIALVRDKQRVPTPPPVTTTSTTDYFQGAHIVECDVTNLEMLQSTMTSLVETYGPIEAVISCLASRSGIKSDAYLIDYQATLNCLTAGRQSLARHFVLLSAFCVKRPTLQFQQAKLKFEAALTAQSDMTYTIVRPTAFFKSVSGQLEVVQSGAPFVMFGNGDITRCNPIAESDLATYLVDSITDPNRRNQIVNLGGPDEGFNMQQQGKMLFEITGMPEKYISAPVWIFDAVINTLQFLANVTKLQALEDAAETGRIGKYYAVEDMWTTDPQEKYGTITLREHYQRIAQYGQEYDPYTTMFARARGVDVKAMREQQQLQFNATTMSEPPPLEPAAQ